MSEVDTNVDPAEAKASEPISSTLNSTLASEGFGQFTTTISKGHSFEIWLRPPERIGRTAWKAAIVSRESVAYGSAFITDGVLRASVPIADPRGHLLFRADMDKGRPVAGPGFVSKFGLL